MTKLLTIALTHADVLRVLATTPGATTSAIAEATGRVKNNIARDLGKLAEAGLVDETARTLTDEGRAMVEALDRAEAPAADLATAPALPGMVAVLHRQIVPDALNPRKAFDKDAIRELAVSIARDGLLENLVVRPSGEVSDDGLPLYRLVAGERRWRAIAFLIENDLDDHQGDAAWPASRPIVCKLVEIDDAAHRRIALVENLQRKDLRPVDEAQALKELMEVTGVGTGEIALEIGFTQRFVQQRLQLLQLDAVDQAAVNAGEMTIELARKTLANRTPPVALDDSALLLLAEIAVHIAGRDKAGRVGRVGPGAHVVDSAVRADERAEGLRKKGLFYQFKSWATGADSVQLEAAGYRALIEAAPRFLEDPEAALVDLQARLAPDKPGDKAYATPWLNPPFTVHHTETARLEQERRDRLARERADEERTRIAAESRVMGRLILQEVRAFEDQAPGMDHHAFTAAYRALTATVDCPAPWSLQLERDEPDITDAERRTPSGYGAALEARRRLICLAVNYASGFAANSGPELATPWAENGDDDDPAFDPAASDDDPDDDPAREDGDDDGDDEDPAPYLRRLAGGA